MARIRSLKPEIWMSPQVMNLSHSARLLFIGLITQADDEGRGTADPRRVKAAIFGGDDIESASVRRWLDEIVAQGLIVTYHDEKHGDLYALPTWKHHQRIDRPGKSGYPSPITQRALDEDSTSIRRGSEGGREGSSGGRDLQDGSEGGKERSAESGISSGQNAPPSEPSERNPPGADRRNGDFERINEGVIKLVEAGVHVAADTRGLARALHCSVRQVEVAVEQLRDRGRLPGAAA